MFYLLLLLFVIIIFLTYRPKEKPKIVAKTIEEESDLYGLCPCNFPFVCDEGICKKPINTPCLVSSECESKSVCLEGICLKKGDKWESPTGHICREGLTPIRNGLFQEGKLIITNCIDIVYLKNKLIVLTDQSLLVNGDKNFEVSRPSLNHFVKMVNLDGILIVYCKKRTYRLDWITPSKIKWSKFKPESNIALEDNTTLIKVGKTYLIDDSHNKILLRNRYNIRSQIESQEYNIRSEIESQEYNIRSADQVVKYHQELYWLKNGNLFKEGNRMEGNWKKIIVCNNKLWLISNYICF